MAILEKRLITYHFISTNDIMNIKGGRQYLEIVAYGYGQKYFVLIKQDLCQLFKNVYIKTRFS